MKFLKLATKASACMFLGAMATVYAAPQQPEKQAEPGKQEAKPQPQQHAQPKQVQPQQQQRAEQPKQAQPQQQQRAQQPKQAQPQQQQRAQQPKQAQPQQQQRAQQPKQAEPQQQQRAQQPKQAEPQQQQRAQQPKQAQPQQQQRAQQPKQAEPQQQRQNAYAPPQRSTQEAQSWQQKSGWRSQGAWQGQATFQQSRSSHWASDHRTWAQRGGYGGYFIPQASFGLYFGVGHRFRIGRQPIVVGGYPQFQYGGYTFALVDPWPADWAENWYDNDELYIAYDNGYYLYDQAHPGEAVAIAVLVAGG